jgi:hypothetical protein
VKKLFLVLLACLPAFAQTSISPLTLRVTDFPQSSPVDTVQIFSRNYAAIDGLAGLVWRMENSGFAGLFPTSDSFARLSLGHIQPLTTLDIRGTPQVNSGLFYMNDQHTFTGSSGTGPLIYGAVGQQLGWAVGIKDSITPDNAYNVDIEGLPGVINSTATRNLRFGVVGTNTTYYPLTVNHTGFVSIGTGEGGNGTLVAVDANLILQGDTNASGGGGTVSLEPTPTKYINLGGGIKHQFRQAAATTTVGTNDYFILATSSINVTNMDASDVGSGRVIWIGGDSGDTATIIPQAGDTVNGAASYTVTSGWAGLTSDGTSNWQVFGLTASSGGSGYDTIEEEGTPLAQESVINFIGSTLTAAAGSGETTVTSDADVDALASAAGTGIYVRTGAGTSAQRSNTSTGGTVLITNPDGVAGNINFEINPNSTAVFTKTLNNNVTNHLFLVTFPSGEMSGLVIEGTISATDSTDFQSFTAQWTVAMVNKAGVVDGDTDQSTASSFSSSGAGITPILTFDNSDSASYVITLDPDSGLTTTSLTFKYTIKNLTGQTITPL